MTTPTQHSQEDLYRRVSYDLKCATQVIQGPTCSAGLSDLPMPPFRSAPCLSRYLVCLVVTVSVQSPVFLTELWFLRRQMPCIYPESPEHDCSPDIWLIIGRAYLRLSTSSDARFSAGVIGTRWTAAQSETLGWYICEGFSEIENVPCGILTNNTTGRIPFCVEELSPRPSCQVLEQQLENRCTKSHGGHWPWDLWRQKTRTLWTTDPDLFHK